MKDVIIVRDDIRNNPVTKGELVALLNQLDSLDKDKNICISRDFLSEIIRLALKSFKDEYEEHYYNGVD